MATGSDSVLFFLQSRGGSAKNSDLLLHFRTFLQDPANRDRNRELFKKFVNSVAIVKQVDGASHVLLRRKFRGHVPGAGRDSPGIPAGNYTEPSAVNASAQPAESLAPLQDPDPPRGQEPRLQQVPVRRFRHRPSYKSAVSQDDDDDEEDEEVPVRPGSGGVWPLNPPLSDSGRTISASSPYTTKSPKPPSSSSSPVPLEPREHAWMVNGAVGAWTEIFSLFREDSSLLNKRDFISGFTVLHWIAKHGNHRALNTLRRFFRFGLTFDINAKSTGGQTPLHLAAIHGHKKVIQLLVRKFDADVRLRDTAGKKPWQYLSVRSPDVLQLLGAPPRAALTERVGEAESDWQPKPQRRRLRHHFSSASSGQRPYYSKSSKILKNSHTIVSCPKYLKNSDTIVSRPKY
uniref:SOWAHA-C winged helix-turn-helix domain-containing protein n=1 Tax=Kryptolebias marmoratus TaxID=37003 RepID=A0A3Q3A2Q2_KRYMA